MLNVSEVYGELKQQDLINYLKDVLCKLGNGTGEIILSTVNIKTEEYRSYFVDGPHTNSFARNPLEQRVELYINFLARL